MNKKEKITDIFKNMEEFQKYILSKRMQIYMPKKYTLYGVHLYEILEKAKLTYSNIKQVSNCVGPVVGVRGTGKELEGTLWGDRNVLILD